MDTLIEDVELAIEFIIEKYHEYDIILMGHSGIN
jgi:alpha-beta hydrolase superfamily lysophospholipase